jgi:transposase
MRGYVDPQGNLLAYFSVEERIARDHPFRRVKAQVDAVLRAMSAHFDAMYAEGGRPSIAPERLLKGSLPIALYSVRSERLFCEMLDSNLLFRWFLDLGLGERAFDHSTFCKNGGRLIEHEIAREFFAGVIREARAQRLLCDEHFTVDGTLIESWASFKSLRRKDGAPAKSGPDGTGMVDFRGREAQQRHTRIEHRPRGEAHEEGQRPARQAQLRGARAAGKPQRSSRRSRDHRRNDAAGRGFAARSASAGARRDEDARCG